MIDINNTLKRIVIPVEIQNREMLAKLYLGAVAASHGYDVVVGDQKEIVRGIFRLKSGVYLDKSVAKTKYRFFQKLKKMGFIPVALCEEGLVYRDKKRYIKERIDRDTLNQANRFYCWGEKQKSDIGNIHNMANKFRIVGNPRFDLLRPEFRDMWKKKSNKIRENQGRFILINTNFSRYNRLPGTDDVITLLEKRGTLDPLEGEEYYRGLVDHLATIYAAFFKMVPEIAKRFPKYSIIIRPHPGENFKPYLELAQGLSNVHVKQGGSVIPWLLAADVIIHNSCTTGVEGWILGQPVISYMPVENQSFDSYLPNELSYKCTNHDELLNTIDKIISLELLTKRDNDTVHLAEYFISGLSKELAADILVKQLPDVSIQSSGLEKIKEGIRSRSKKFLRMIPGIRISKGLRALAKQKFPGITLTEASGFIQLISTCRPELKNIHLSKMAGWDNVFHIIKKE